MARAVTAIAAGTVAGLAISVGTFAIWMRYGADPDKDPLVSW